MCVCERERGRQAGRERESVCVCERESYYIVTIYIWVGLIITTTTF